MDKQQQAWRRQPGEPQLWFTRFKYYLDMGKTRSINGVYEFLRDGPEKGRINQKKAPATFYEIPNRWNWKQRAAAYDDWNDDQAAKAAKAASDAEIAAEKTARIDAQKLRRDIIAELMTTTRATIGLAEMENWDTNTARRRFPDLIRFMEILLKAHRMEFGEPITEAITTTTTTTTSSERPVNADDMAAALQALKEKDFPTITLPILQTTTTTTTIIPNHDANT